MFSGFHTEEYILALWLLNRFLYQRYNRYRPNRRPVYQGQNRFTRYFAESKMLNLVICEVLMNHKFYDSHAYLTVFFKVQLLPLHSVFVFCSRIVHLYRNTCPLLHIYRDFLTHTSKSTWSAFCPNDIFIFLVPSNLFN